MLAKERKRGRGPERKDEVVAGACTAAAAAAAAAAVVVVLGECKRPAQFIGTLPREFNAQHAVSVRVKRFGKLPEAAVTWRCGCKAMQRFHCNGRRGGARLEEEGSSD